MAQLFLQLRKRYFVMEQLEKIKKLRLKKTNNSFKNVIIGLYLFDKND